MMSISGYGEFLYKFNDVKDRSRLFMFILFDDRPTHAVVERYVDEHFYWLDSLAASANIFGFAFLRRDENTGRLSNPSLKVGNHFGIRANQLPGVVVFTMLPGSVGVSKAVYLPIKAKLFAEDGEVIEKVLADLFAVLQEALASTSSEVDLLDKLGSDIESIRRQQKIRPIVAFLGERLESLAKMPDKLLEAMAEAFGESLAKRIGS